MFDDLMFKRSPHHSHTPNACRSNHDFIISTGVFMFFLVNDFQWRNLRNFYGRSKFFLNEGGIENSQHRVLLILALAIIQLFYFFQQELPQAN